MAAQTPTHFNPYYNDIILRNVDGTNNSSSIKLIEAAKEGCTWYLDPIFKNVGTFFC